MRSRLHRLWKKRVVTTSWQCKQDYWTGCSHCFKEQNPVFADLQSLTFASCCSAVEVYSGCDQEHLWRHYVQITLSVAVKYVTVNVLSQKHFWLAIQSTEPRHYKVSQHCRCMSMTPQIQTSKFSVLLWLWAWHHWWYQDKGLWISPQAKDTSNHILCHRCVAFYIKYWAKTDKLIFFFLQSTITETLLTNLEKQYEPFDMSWHPKSVETELLQCLPLYFHLHKERELKKGKNKDFEMRQLCEPSHDENTVISHIMYLKQI